MSWPVLYFFFWARAAFFFFAILFVLFSIYDECSIWWFFILLFLLSWVVGFFVCDVCFDFLVLGIGIWAVGCHGGGVPVAAVGQAFVYFRRGTRRFCVCLLSGCLTRFFGWLLLISCRLFTELVFFVIGGPLKEAGFLWWFAGELCGWIVWGRLLRPE